jgi:hypothetical protein
MASTFMKGNIAELKVFGESHEEKREGGGDDGRFSGQLLYVSRLQ